MAQLIPKLNCALCGGPLDALGDFFRTTGIFLPPADPLSRFCNRPLHWNCYEKWKERPRFAQQYVEAWAKANQRNPFWWAAYCDEHVYISINPEPPVEEASVRLTAIGSDIRVPLPKWNDWLADPATVTPSLHDVERRALANVLPMLRQKLPDDHAVVHAIDPDEKRPASARRSVTS